MSYNIFPAALMTGVPAQIVKRPSWNTSKEKTPAGNEFRVGFQQNPLAQFSISYPALSQADKNVLEGFLNQQGGSLTPFYFDVLNDDTISTPFGFGTGDGATTAFTLLKPAGNGAVEPIGGANVVSAIYSNGILVSGSGWSVAGNVLTFTTAPANGAVLTWTGTYYYLVRFGEDYIDFTQFANALYKTAKITLEQCI